MDGNNNIRQPPPAAAGGSGSGAPAGSSTSAPSPRTTNELPKPLIKTTDPESVFFTDAFNESKRLWEIFFMGKMVLGIQSLIDKELEGDDHGFFLLFLKYDLNLNGTLSVDEIAEMLHEYGIDQKATAKALARSIEPDDPENVEFVDFLRWFETNGKNHQAFEQVGFRITDSAAKLLGTSLIAPITDRVKTNLSREQLKQSIVNYRQLYANLRIYKANQAFRHLPDDPLEEIKVLYSLISKELSTENEALFNLFAEHDNDLDGKLDKDEQRQMFRKFDSSASENEISIYLKEVNADPVLQFLDFLDWWEQSKIVPQSLVSRKKLAKQLANNLLTTTSTASTVGTNLLAKIGADNLFGNLFGHELRKKWEALGAEDLIKLSEVYKVLYIDLRNYSMEHYVAELETSICGNALL
ncbi:unnamed protein product [Amoebophrya sp. A120]|nr:unnamed protein product [Amoebophrya sp. A120]|eukprot:GSA120T00020998001.1